MDAQELDGAVAAVNLNGLGTNEGRDDGGQAEDHVRLERLRLEFSAWMDEYKTLRGEISQTLTSSRQITQFAIIAIAGQVSLAAYILQNDLPILFLIAPFVFYSIAWTQLRLSYTTRSISDYILVHICRGAHHVLEEIAHYEPPPRLRFGNSHLSERLTPLHWDEVVRHEMHTFKRRLWIIEASAFIIPVTTAVLLPGAYFAYVLHFHFTISIYAEAYILINEGVCIYTVMMGMWMRRFHQAPSGPYRQPRIRYCDLFLFQLANFLFQVRVTWLRNRHDLKAILKNGRTRRQRRPRRVYLPWYDRPAHFLILWLHRLCRLALWGSIAFVTVVKIANFNSEQRAYAHANSMVFKLKDGSQISGILVTYDGTKYVVNSHNNREEIDFALIKPKKP